MTINLIRAVPVRKLFKNIKRKKKMSTTQDKNCSESIINELHEEVAKLKRELAEAKKLDQSMKKHFRIKGHPYPDCEHGAVYFALEQDGNDIELIAYDEKDQRITRVLSLDAENREIEFAY